MIKIAKFGGTSLADASQIKKVLKIVRSDRKRQYIVVSAPGKRNSRDEKVTDMLYRLHRDYNGKKLFEMVSDRYLTIVNELGIDLDLTPHLEKIWQKVLAGCSIDYLVSRGEYLSGLIIATALGFPFIDAADVVRFDSNGKYSPTVTARRMVSIRNFKNAVIPGFYGAMPNGEIKTFSRGGSDVTGAIVAKEVGAEVYENWTDVDGILMADPRVVENPRQIKKLTYRELRELAYMGANVLHDEAVFPVREAGIPINVRNTNNPKDGGTWIVPEIKPETRICGSIIGIAGRRDFTIITVTKIMMNQELGFARKICAILERHGVSFEHMPSGIDTISIIVADKALANGKLKKIRGDIRKDCSPDSIDVVPNIALVCTVGQAMVHTPGVAAKVLTALAHAKINVRMINQGSSEMNIIVGVNNADYENSVRAIHEAFAA